MATVRIGLTSIVLGPIAGNGGMGTVLTQIGDTVEGTPTYTVEDPTKVDFPTEESDTPYYSTVTKQGKESFTWQSYQFDADTLVRLFGGTKAVGPPETWSAPASVPEIEQSMRITWKNGGSVDYPRVKLTAKKLASFKKGEPSKLEITADILQPTLAGTPSQKFTLL